MDIRIALFLVVVLCSLNVGTSSARQAWEGQNNAWPDSAGSNSTSSNSINSNSINSNSTYPFQRHHHLNDKKSFKHGDKQHKRRHHHGRCHGKKSTLSILLHGSGSGRVSSAPAGIFCERDCSQKYKRDTPVTLTATPYSGSQFIGWSGGNCSGTDSCTLSVGNDTTISAQFALLEPAPVELITPYVDEADMREIDGVFNAIHIDNFAGQVHDGLDIYPKNNLTPFRASCSGTVQPILLFDFLVVVLIQCNSGINIEIGFEPNVPNTGETQLSHILVTEGQFVSQGDVVGYLFMPAHQDRSHVHFTLRKHGVPSCPETYFTPMARDSILNVLDKIGVYSAMCLSGDVTPQPLLTPYVNESDMKKIKRGFSTEGSLSPWSVTNDGIDIYPGADLTPFQATCSGRVETIELHQDVAHSNWQVDVSIKCDEYVYDPNVGQYFWPFSTRYSFRTMSRKQRDGLSQLGNIMVIEGQTLSQGDIIGYLNRDSKHSHLRYSLLEFADSELQVYGITGFPICPEPHFTAQANASVLNLLHKTWPTASLCYP